MEIVIWLMLKRVFKMALKVKQIELTFYWLQAKYEMQLNSCLTTGFILSKKRVGLEAEAAP